MRPSRASSAWYVTISSMPYALIGDPIVDGFAEPLGKDAIGEGEKDRGPDSLKIVMTGN